MKRAPRHMCAAIFKKKNVVGEKHQKVLMVNYTLRFFLKISLYGRLWQGNLILAAVSAQSDQRLCY